MTETIKLSHGDGGLAMQHLIGELISCYDMPVNTNADSFVFPSGDETLAFTQDGFTVKPLFFSGGDIGKLSVCGTVNDLATAGAIPLYISAGFILEEGFPLETLRKIARSMGETCKSAGVKIVTGDTKVVEKGHADGIYISTAGIGKVSGGYKPKPIEPGDAILITGTIGEHGTTIMNERYQLGITGDIQSDCQPLGELIPCIAAHLPHIKRMNDPTRGGVAGILSELAEESRLSAELVETDLPVRPQIRAVNDLLGTDPLYLACEGRMVLVVAGDKTEQVLEALEGCKLYKGASRIGCFTEDKRGALLFLRTALGGSRILPPPDGRTIPRIC